MPGKLNNFVQNLIIEYKLTQSLLLTSPWEMVYHFMS